MRFDDRSESLDLVKVRRFLQIRVEFVYGIEGIEISLRVMKEPPIFDVSRRQNRGIFWTFSHAREMKVRREIEQASVLRFLSNTMPHPNRSIFFGKCG